MPNPNGLIDRVSSLSTSREEREALESQLTPQLVTVSFQGGRSGRLDVTIPRSAVWAEMLEFLRENNRPAYVEIDPDSNLITRFAIPEGTKVLSVAPDPEGDLNVILVVSEAVHHVRASNPDFATLRAALESARDDGSDVLVTATLHRHEIIDVRPLPKAPAPEAPPKPAPAPAPAPGDVPQPVTEQRAKQLFDLMSARSCDCSVTPPCIPFKYPPDGCYARAHEMCRLMIAEGEQPEKVWIYGYPKPSTTLVVKTSNEPEKCQVTWWYHVAPTLLVSTSGGSEKRVIDPSLCSGPVSPAAWKGLQGDPNATLEYTDANPFWPDGATDANYSQTNYYLKQKRGLLKDWCTTYGPPPYSCPIKKQCVLITDRSTFGEDEITSMLQSANPAVIQAAFYVVVDGFSPKDLGVNTFVPPNQKPTITVSPSVAGMSVKVTQLAAEFPSYLERRQRLTWTCNVEFANTNGFTAPVKTATVTASIGGVTGSALIRLIQQPNPYEVDGPVSWLSTDLRVFQLKEGESRFGATMGNSPAGASAFIKKVIANLNAGNTGAQTFESISTNQQTSQLELSEKVNGKRVFNFAVAKVRYRGTIAAQKVRVFFRLLPVSTTSTAYQQATTYRRGGQAGVTIPLLGVQGGALSSIPCFAEPRVNSATANLNAQSDPTNVQTLQPTGGAEHAKYFGCWLDINQVDAQFPDHPNPTDGPFASGRKTIQELVKGQHQCLVAEIAFDPDPIPAGVSPGASDKLAQRNLSIVPSANPGDLSSRRIPLTFEVRPSAAKTEAGGLPDEVMIHWGNTPAGSRATLFLPGVGAEEVLDMAKGLYGTHRLELVDAHTLGCPAAGVTYVPLPAGARENYAGLLTVDLPATVRRGQAFTIVVRQLTDARGAPPIIIEAPSDVEDESTSAIRWRKVLGTFQLTVPVRTKEVMLEPEARLLSVLRWIQKSIPEGDRWHPVFRRYVEQTAGRVDALGGYSETVVASPSGEDVTLRIRILGPHGEFFGQPVDIEVKHRTLETEPRREFKRVIPTNLFLVDGLRRFPQSDYVVTITPSDWFHPEGQFVTIPPSGTAECTFVFAKEDGGKPPADDVTLRLRVLDKQGGFFGEPVDIDIRHRTLATEPRLQFRRVATTEAIAIEGLRRFPQSDYIVTVTPSGEHRPQSQFVTIPASGFATMEVVL